MVLMQACVCVLQQPKPGEPLYAQVNLEKKKKRQYEMGAGQVQGGQGVQGGAISGGTGNPQWVRDGVGIQEQAVPTTASVPPSTTAPTAGDSWV